ncbi:MAG: class I SAM-dependent methyltransferase [Chloroflexi bacterium]|nr:class I SAM-dependent methyltransferase [Chloroflexota bacterium]
MEPVDQRPRTLRSLFDDVADDYDAIRPGYPAALIDDIAATLPSPDEARILEVGCGTGQATLPFAQRGYGMLCLDIGPALAARAAERCRPYPKVRIEVAAFEEWPAQPATFDLLMSATAFHWIPPEVGYPKAAQILKPTGRLAIFSNEHPTPVTGFFAEAQAIYRRFVPQWNNVPDSPALEERIAATAARINATALFEPVVVKTYAWSQTYTAQQHIRLLNTYSDHRNLPPEQRRQLFQALADLIDASYGGAVTKPYLAVLYLARKRSSS